MQEEIISLKNEALAQIMEAKSEDELEGLRISYLGRTGKFTNLIKKIKEIKPEQRGQVGASINEAKNTLLTALVERKTKIGISAKVWFDPTVPGIKPETGHLHLVTQAIEEISAVFSHLGFSRVRYPEVEWDLYAFEYLNMPQNHPARDEWETFFIDVPENSKYGKMVLTPHTSNGQVREMLRVKNALPAGRQAPIRMINIAKCYRRQLDVSHTPMFHQFEGLVIDKNISIANLKGTIDYFVKSFFGPQRLTRLRPYHFQFTEPSFEVDVSCGICNGQGCKLCKSGWLELGGAGMVHPNVLRNGNIDPNKYSGFAFGWGVERTYMMKAGINIPDLRMLYSSDLKYLRQF